jgi:hypothetical protein
VAADPPLPKLPAPLQAIADHLRPALSTSPDDVLPDIGPGMGDARDKGLDGLAEGATNVRPLPAGDSASAGEQEVAAALDASIAAARSAVQSKDELPVLPPPHDPLRDLSAPPAGSTTK